MQDRYLNLHIFQVMRQLLEPLNSYIETANTQKQVISKQDAYQQLEGVLTYASSTLKSIPLISRADEYFRTFVQKEINKKLPDCISSMLRGSDSEYLVPDIIQDYQDQLSNLLADAFMASVPCTESHSGIVISGFGDKDIFPSTRSYCIEGLYERLKFWDDKCHDITLDDTARIIPFAQSDVIDTFLQGVHPAYKDNMNAFVHKVIEGYPHLVRDVLEEQKVSNDIVECVVSTLVARGRYCRCGGR